MEFWDLVAMFFGNAGFSWQVQGPIRCVRSAVAIEQIAAQDWS